MKMKKKRTVLFLSLFVLAAWLAVYFAAIRPPMLEWGATPGEQLRPLPAEDIPPNAVRLSTRAITVEAPPERVWPWLA